MLWLLNWAGPALARRVSIDRAAGDGWGAHTPPCAPFCCLLSGREAPRKRLPACLLVSTLV
jgi:hypothetical protein